MRRTNPEADALRCLEHVAEHPDPAVFALVDLHPWLDDPLVVRALRDLRARLTHRGQTLLLVTPELQVPRELETDVLLFDVPLPGYETLRALLDQEAEQVGHAPSPEAARLAIRAVQGLTADAARRAFRRALMAPDGLREGGVAGLVEEKRRILRRTDLLEFVDAPPSLDEVGGLEALKAWLRERERAFGEDARRFGLPVPKGLLLVGVQGCGKSLTAKAVASLWNLPLARLDFGMVFGHGRSPEENLRRVLHLAETLSPVVLWVDEIDKAFQTVGRADGGSEVLHRLFAAFVTWLQEKTAPAFVVATANAVEHLPAELLRKGRFDEIFFVDLPGEAERRHILSIHLQSHGRDPADFDVAGMASLCEHFSGAEIEQLVVSGLYRAFREGRDLADEDLRVAVKSTVPLYRTYEDAIKALREWARPRARKASVDSRIADLWDGSA
ncbi:MAG: AAA family ATPase [Myxococcota bacterium]